MSKLQGNLIPVEVPWQLSPSVESLTVHAEEEHHCLTTTFCANTWLAGEMAWCQIRVRFDGIVTCRFDYRPEGFLDEEEEKRARRFDDSALGREYTPKAIEEFQSNFRRTGICPDPGMYEVTESKWLGEWRGYPGPRLVYNVDAMSHFLIRARHVDLEVIAGEWAWFLEKDTGTRLAVPTP